MKNLLFPYIFKKVGAVLFCPALILGILRICSALPATGLLALIINDFIILGLTLGSLFIVCSKEKFEDEMIAKLRLSSILNALYVFAALFTVGTLLINGEDYVNFVLYLPATLPLLIIFLFRAEIYRHNKQASDEEQD